MTQVGDRVMLVRTDDEYTKLVMGSMGTVQLIDSTGTVHVRWDNGSQLGLNKDFGDKWTVMKEVG